MTSAWPLALAAFASVALNAQAAEYLPIAGGELRSALPLDAPTVRVAPYRLRSAPVTNAQFAAFINKNPQWRRDKVPAVFASARYLEGWKSPTNFAPHAANAPVTSVSWFAAQAFCATEGARLPTWHEWELAAAADETRRDARSDAVWRAHILNWYAKPADALLAPVGQRAPNVYGARDMHGLIWEWVDDYNGLFVTVDSRNQGEQKLLESCGAAALSLGDRDNYAVLMRVALLASLDGKDTVRSLGFRCARSN